MRLSAPHPQLRIEEGCVVSYCPIASALGSRVLQEGGNAVDAAVATALALAVTYPQAGNLGGGGFLLVSPPGDQVHALDFRETAPGRIRLEHFLDPSGQVAEGQTLLGALGVGVPGTVAGLAEALTRFGSWSWDRVVAPIIELAEHGYWLTARQAGYLKLFEGELSRFESTRGYFTVSGHAPRPGTLVRQPDLGRTLRALAHDGPRAFYQGPLAERIVAELERHGGLLDAEDLAGYVPRWREPLTRRFLGREVSSAPLPSAGGLIVQLGLAALEAIGATEAPRDSVERLERLARVFRVAFFERARLAGDPDRLTAAERKEVQTLAESTLAPGELERLERALAAGDLPRSPDPRAQRANTTHFCVLDRQGGAVSGTYSLNTMFGSKLAVSGAGFLLNNCIDDFRLSAELSNKYELIQGERNQLHPGARPASSMAPTMVRSDGQVELVLGASGGPRIPTLILQVLVSVLGDGISLRQAMQAPRIHHQFVPDALVLEQSMPEAQVRALGERGWPLDRAPLLGLGAAILRHPGSDEVSATLDNRFSFE